MKRQTREYDYDRMLWWVFFLGTKLYNGSPKELEATLKLVPNFETIMRMIVSTGEAGKAILALAGEYVDDILTAHEKGKKLCLGTFMGNKMICFAFDNVVPIWAEPITGLTNMLFRQGNSEYYDYCVEKGFTETSCSGQRGVVGAMLAGLAQKPDFVIIGSSGPCDTNANSMQFYSSYADIPMLVLDTPATLISDRVDEFQFQDMKDMIASIEEIAGTPINEDRLREILEEKKYQDKLFNELMDLTMLKPSPVPAVFQFLAFGAIILAPGKKTCTRLFEAMLDVVRKNAKEGRAGTYSGKERARAMFFYIEHFTTDMRFWDWAMSNDISLFPCIVTTTWNEGINYAKGREAEAYHIDTTDMDSMIRSLASVNSRMAMNKQLRGPYDAPTQWRDDCLGIAKLMKPDFLIYTGTMGCRNSWGVNKLLQRDAERAGFPTLINFADAFDDRVVSWEAYRDKIMEFMKVRGIGA